MTESAQWSKQSEDGGNVEVILRLTGKIGAYKKR